MYKDIEIVKIDSKLLEKTAYCHLSAFPNSYTSKLGLKYVIKMLEWFIVSKDRFLIGVKTEENIVGYIGGAKGFGSTSGMLQYAFRQGVLSLMLRPYLIFNLTFLSNLNLIFKNVKRRYFPPKESGVDSSQTKIPLEKEDLSVGLVVIGVNPKFRRKGVANKLLSAFVANSKQLGCGLAHLSVKTDNVNAIDAYTKNGWKIMKFNKTVTNMRIKIR